MLTVSFTLDIAHICAFQRLMERLDLQLVERYAGSDQERYDWLFCLETLKTALRGVSNPAAGAAVPSGAVDDQATNDGDFPEYRD